VTPTPGTRPVPERIAVSLEALRADAADWDHAAADLRGAAHRADAVVVPSAAFSFAGGPVAEAYELLRGHTVALLSGGAGNFGAIAAALRAAAATYEADELNNVHRLRNVY
jgi:hypothetical protein